MTELYVLATEVTHSALAGSTVDQKAVLLALHLRQTQGKYAVTVAALIGEWGIPANTVRRALDGLVSSGLVLKVKPLT